MQSLIIGVDFDGTVVEHEFYKIGKDVPHAVRVLQKLQDKHHRIMLWTMRSDQQQHMFQDGSLCPDTTVLKAAMKWFDERGVWLWAANKNPEQTWSNSNKQYCNFYIDDAAIGCPLIYPEKYNVANEDQNIQHVRPYVDWLKIEKILIKQGII